MFGQFVDVKLCDQLIDAFENNPNMHLTGRVGDGVVPTVKDSTDLCLRELGKQPAYKDIVSEYLRQFSIVVNRYKETYPQLDKQLHSWSMNEPANIQRYYPGQGFPVAHCERSGHTISINQRMAVFMTYLNEVEDSGTEFLHQNFICPAKRGLTLLWPPDWTFTHRGIISYTKTKYIVTGWLSFDDPISGNSYG